MIESGINKRTGENYEQFIEKFKPKKTTDDCYTPDNIYEVIADWVANEYGLDKKNFVRPFWPGAEYKEYEYKEGQVVVDNPPFSINAKIIEWFHKNGIKFFLFCPGLTAMSSSSSSYATVLCCGCSITYDNNAKVTTSFVTNLEPENIRARTVPDLFKLVEAENRKNEILKLKNGELPKYDYPDNVVSAAMMNKLAKYGIEYSFTKSGSYHISKLDAQKDCGKTIFGGGYLISEKAAAEKAAAEKAAAEKVNKVIWELSDREKEIINNLN